MGEYNPAVVAFVLLLCPLLFCGSLEHNNPFPSIRFEKSLRVEAVKVAIAPAGLDLDWLGSETYNLAFGEGVIEQTIT